MQDKVKGTTPAVFAEFRKGLERSARGFFAPFRCVDAVEAAATLPFDEGLRRERELFTQCMQSTQSKAQIHVFFSEREVAKIPDVPKETPVRPIKSAAVIGAGTMGGGIAMNFANAGIPVRVVEMSQEALDRGLAVVRKNYAATVEKGRLSQKDMDARMALIQGGLGYDGIDDADIVVEAVFEEMDVKKKVFATLDRAARPDAILASNTSTLDIDQMAGATSRPGQVIGTHFFSPANVMRLLEIVRGKATSKETIATTMDLARRIRKVGVLVGNCDGFVGNRMLAPYLREAEFLVEEGATPSRWTRSSTTSACPWVRSRWATWPGSTWAGASARARRPRATGGSATRPSPTASARWGASGRRPARAGIATRRAAARRSPIPRSRRSSRRHPRSRGIERRAVSDEEILKRCVYALINEGARILEEGFALRASDIDIIYIYGYGFPVHRGGPDVLRGHGGAGGGVRRRLRLPEAARRAVAAGAAAGAPGARGQALPGTLAVHPRGASRSGIGL